MTEPDEKRELLASYTRKDFRIDTMPSGGPGGQHQNKTQSAVRITHIETGLASECREHRSQHMNKKEAFRKLGEKIKKHWQNKISLEKIRLNHVVRSYNEPDNRVKDHLTGHVEPFDDVLDDPSEMIRLRVEAMNDEKKNDSR